MASGYVQCMNYAEGLHFSAFHLQVRHVLTFWRDGFSVDDGPLRTGDTPEDKAFIDGVRRG